MAAIVDVDAIPSFDVRLPNESRREADAPSPCQFTGEDGEGVNIFVE